MLFCSISQQPVGIPKCAPSESIENIKLPMQTNFEIFIFWTLRIMLNTGYFAAFLKTWFFLIESSFLMDSGYLNARAPFQKVKSQWVIQIYNFLHVLQYILCILPHPVWFLKSATLLNRLRLWNYKFSCKLWSEASTPIFSSIPWTDIRSIQHI